VYFLHDAEERRRRHAQLGEFFSGAWADRSKPYNDRLKAAVQKKVAGEESGDRRVRPQPLCLREGKSIFATKGDAGAVNERRCREAVHHFIAAGMLCEAANELCCFEGICARARCGEASTNLTQLLDLSDSISKQVQSRNVSALHRLQQVKHYAAWLKKDLSSIASNPDMQFIFDSCCRQPEVSLARKDFVTYMQRTSAGLSLGCGPLHRSILLGPSQQDFDSCISKYYYNGVVQSIAYNFDGSLLVSAFHTFSAKTVTTWDIAAVCNAKTGIVEFVLKGNAVVFSVAWSPNGQQLVTGEMQPRTPMMMRSV